MAVEAMNEDDINRRILTWSVDLRQAKLLDERGAGSSHSE